MKILAVIPARAGSKGVPGKNKKILNGKPLIHYTIESAIECNCIHKVVVSSDDQDILKMQREYSNVHFLNRPALLAADNIATLPVIANVLEVLEKARNSEKFDLICILQPTNPFRPSGFIQKCFDKYFSSDCDSFVSVLRVPHVYNPHWTFEKDSKGFLKIATGEREIISRRQDLPEAFIRDGSVYITTAQNIMIHHRILGEKICYIESDPNHYMNIDTPEDWILAEQKAKEIFS